MTGLLRVYAWGLVALTLVAALAGAALAETTPGAKALESRLHAPCCYQGTLDTHESDLARTLRAEIESRLSRGETTEAVQADFVARYGEKVLAARSDSPIRAMGIFVALAIAAAAVSLGIVVRRWARNDRRGPPERAPSEPSVSKDDPLDERIDAELAALDEGA